MARVRRPVHGGRVAPAELLHDAVRRVVMAGHEGKSGAGLEKVWLADGRALVVKRVTRESDFTLALTGGTVARECLLWHSGVLNRLPPGVTHAILDAWVEEDGTSVIVMRDLGAAVLTWDDRLSVATTHRVVERVAALHREFLDSPPQGLAPLRRVLELFAPQRIARLADAGSELCAQASAAGRSSPRRRRSTSPARCWCCSPTASSSRTPSPRGR